MKKEEDFDDIFKKGLGEGAEPTYREEDWNALAQMLDAPKKKLGLVFWIPVLSSAAVLLIAFGWWVLRPENARNRATNFQAQAIAKQQGVKSDDGKTKSMRKKEMGSGDRSDTGDSQKAVKNISSASARKKEMGSGDRSDTSDSQKAAKNTYAASARKKEMGSGDRKDSNPEEILVKHSRQRHSTKSNTHDLLAVNEQTMNPGNQRANKSKHNRNQINENNDSDGVADNGTATNTVINQTRDADVLVAYSHGLTIEQFNAPTGINDFSVQPTVIEVKHSLLPIKRIKPVVKSNGFHPQYALSVIGAPEVNGVNSLSQTSKGTNLGLLFSLEVFNKVFVSTGAMYSIKPYNSNVSNYSYNAVVSNRNISSINANCRVLDVPLNLDYQFYNKHQNMLSVGTGLSSYIMLYEHYQYNYANADIAPYNKTIQQTNKYILGVLNLQATYSRQVTSNVSLSLQPYIKLPLTGIGATSANLQTAGFAIGLNWNFSSLYNH